MTRKQEKQKQNYPALMGMLGEGCVAREENKANTMLSYLQESFKSGPSAGRYLY